MSTRSPLLLAIMLPHLRDETLAAVINDLSQRNQLADQAIAEADAIIQLQTFTMQVQGAAIENLSVQLIDTKRLLAASEQTSATWKKRFDTEYSAHTATIGRKDKISKDLGKAHIALEQVTAERDTAQAALRNIAQAVGPVAADYAAQAEPSTVTPVAEGEPMVNARFTFIDPTKAEWDKVNAVRSLREWISCTTARANEIIETAADFTISKKSFDSLNEVLANRNTNYKVIISTPENGGDKTVN